MGYLGGLHPGGLHPGGPLPGGPLPSADIKWKTQVFRLWWAADLPEECVACVRWGQRTSRKLFKTDIDDYEDSSGNNKFAVGWGRDLSGQPRAKAQSVGQ